MENYFLSSSNSADRAGFGWQDINVLKLGLQYQYNHRLQLRAGYNHGGQPVPPSQTLNNLLAPGVVQDHVSLGFTWHASDNEEFSMAYTHAFKKTIRGKNSIPAAFGSGEANIYLEQNILGLAYGKRY